MNKKIIVSAFDGISCGQIALNKIGIYYDEYHSYEIDKDPIRVTQNQFPHTIQKGSVLDFDESEYEDENVFMLIGGSPCQSFSRGGDNTGFEGKSGLFWKYVDMLQKLKPKYFILENVVMKKEWEKIITKAVGVDPIMIDSKLVSAQKRQRLYWTNIPGVTQPDDRDILIQHIMEHGFREPINHDDLMWFEDGEWRVKNATKKGYLVPSDYDCVNLDFPNSKTRRGRVAKWKSNTLNTSCNQGIFLSGRIYKLTPLECERLQTIPDNYTSILKDGKRRNVIGNGWTVDVIAHLMKGL